MSKKVLAVDYGASSGRGILAELDNGRITLTEIHRFENVPVRVNGTLYWDVFRLYHELKKCLSAARGHDIESVAVDTWGVDFAVVSQNGKLVESPVHYRDERTAGIIDSFSLTRERLYDLTGIEIMEINSVFQLCSLIRSKDIRLNETDELLFIREKTQEYAAFEAANKERFGQFTSELLLSFQLARDDYLTGRIPLEEFKKKLRSFMESPIWTTFFPGKAITKSSVIGLKSDHGAAQFGKQAVRYFLHRVPRLFRNRSERYRNSPTQPLRPEGFPPTKSVRGQD